LSFLDSKPAVGENYFAQDKDNRYKMEIEIPSFSPVFSKFMGPSKESVLFRISSLSTSYINSMLKSK
jgi:hypothetical protein